MTPPEWEEPLPTLTGRAWAFMQLTATDILAANLAALPPNEARRRVFAGLDPAFAARLRTDDMLVAEEYLGDPTSAAPALRALRAAGITALAARRFDPAIEDAALAAGIVPVRLDAPSFLHTGDRMRVDLDAAKIVNLSSGDRAAIRNLGDVRRSALRAMFERLDPDA